MVSQALAQVPQPTIWGHSPAELHDRFWASRGVQVVRQGESCDLEAPAELFLLTDARSLVIFDLRELLPVLSWTKPDVLYVRLVDNREQGYRERAMVDGRGMFVEFRRSYGGSDSRLARVAITLDRELARRWRDCSDARSAWEMLRRHVTPSRRLVRGETGSVYDRSSDRELAELTRHLVRVWRRPSSTIPRATRGEGATWTDAHARVGRDVCFVGPVWVGAGRSVEPGTSVVGPSILWDSPESRPAVGALEWDRIEPAAFLRAAAPRPGSSLGSASKRAFDIAFSLVALLLTLPLYPLVMLAIWLEDGRPFFFLHPRETQGGRRFPCIKFRSMRKDAEQTKKRLAAANQADGPQFYMERDPRLTRVGALLRRWNVDELPQFINVLLGQMSVVGPRPSPFRENQYCPPWREARLSVRPGVTGLWQVMRTREPGVDFQEWIKYDIQYVENRGWWMDLWIIAQTVRRLL